MLKQSNIRTKQFLYCLSSLCKPMLLSLRCLLATSCRGSAAATPWLLLRGCKHNRFPARRCCQGMPPKIQPLPVGTRRRCYRGVLHRETRDAPGMARSGTGGGAALQIKKSSSPAAREGIGAGRGGADRAREREARGRQRARRSGSVRREPVPRRPLVLEVSHGSGSGTNIRFMGTRW